MTYSTMGTLQERSESRRKPVKVAQALQYLIKEAFLQGRLFHGVLECAKILKRTPGQVVICVLQKSASTSSEKSTHRKLLEAYCREKNVRLVQVDSCKKLTQLIEEPEQYKEEKTDMDKTTQEKGCNSATERLVDSECLLITKSDVASVDEDFVVTYHDMAVFANVLPFPFIAIPE